MLKESIQGFSDTYVEDWDKYFFNLAKSVASKSKDPSTQIGAVIVDNKKIIRGIGYNGFPRGVNDTLDRWRDRETKLDYVVHGELNAILNSTGRLDGCSIYVYPLFTCNNCAKAVIQSGIIRVVCNKPDYTRSGWEPFKYREALQMYKEAGVKVDYVE